MHTIPNIPFGKVTTRHVVRVFFPRMYGKYEGAAVPSSNLKSIYNRALRPIMLQLMPNHATHWPVKYEAAMALYRDDRGQIHPGSLDVPSHLLPQLAEEYLQRIANIHTSFHDAYFGHELCGWKAATAHDADNEDDRNLGLEDLTHGLDLDQINDHQWKVDVALEFGVPGHIITWCADTHATIIQWILPNLQNVDRIKNSKHFYHDKVTHLQDIAGFRWTPSS